MIAFPGFAWGPEILVQPLLFSALLAAGMGLCVYLFVTLKTEMRGLVRRSGEERQQIESLEIALAAARGNAETLKNDLRLVERQTGMLVAPSPARAGLNLSKRTQVLRMHRAGEDNGQIASSLSLPRSEVDLLIKVHEIVIQQI